VDLDSPITSLDDLSRLDPTLVDALDGTSRQFFEPPSPRTYLEVGRKPFHNSTLQFLPNQPVSRAWDLVFRVTLAHAVNAEFGRFRDLRYYIPPQSDPAYLVVELHGPVNADTKRFAGALNFATETANAVTPQAATSCRDEHERLALELGLSRPPLGFRG
jgi:hypothetical protein